MSLTMGSGPFGHRPAGRFNVDIPVREVMFVDPCPRRIRALRGGDAVVDSRRAKMLHQHGVLPRYFFPMGRARWSPARIAARGRAGPRRPRHLRMG
jgi:hypothetical protein